jgi:hypothetical protein
MAVVTGALDVLATQELYRVAAMWHLVIDFVGDHRAAVKPQSAERLFNPDLVA